MRLVVGLGNPGREYEGTRHNLGFRVVDLLAERAGASWRLKGDRAEAQGEGVLFLKPLAYMNLSGPPAREALSYRNLLPADCLVVCDDLALPVGTIRLRASGSSGGHHGLDSLIAALGTKDFPRLRIGIGSPPSPAQGADYVLGRPPEGERKALEEAVLQAAATAETWILKGVDGAGQGR